METNKTQQQLGVVTKMQNDQGQALVQSSLLDFGDMDLTTRNRVFTQNEKHDDKGMLVSQSLALRKTKEAAQLLGLTSPNDKEKLQEAILKGRDRMKDQIAQLLTKLNGDPKWTGTGLRVTKSKRGLLSLTARLNEVARNTGPSDEAIAKSLGISVEEVAKMRERQQKFLADREVEEKKAAESQAAQKPAEPKPAAAAAPQQPQPQKPQQPPVKK